MILVPLFDLKFLNEPRRDSCRNFKSAALVLRSYRPEGLGPVSAIVTEWKIRNRTGTRPIEFFPTSVTRRVSPIFVEIVAGNGDLDVAFFPKQY